VKEIEKTISDYLESKDGFIRYALSEFRHAGWMDENGKFLSDNSGHNIQELICLDMLEILEVFSRQGHLNSSASYLIPRVSKLMRFEPIAPLTGSDDEWIALRDGVFQNKRCSHVFKQADCFNGQAYNSEGRVFRSKDSVSYTNSNSFVPITFPYVPEVEYVDVEDDEEAGEVRGWRE
jgi:hypothetical protein